MTSESERRAEELREVKEEIRLDEKEMRRLDELAEEARIRNRIIRAEIMSAAQTQAQTVSGPDAEVKLSGDGDDGGDGGGSKIELNLDKDLVSKGSLRELGEMFGVGSEIAFNPSGNITVRFNEGSLNSVLGRVMEHESAAFRGKSGLRTTSFAQQASQPEMYSSLREVLTRRAMDSLRAKGQREGLNADEVARLRWLMEGQHKADFRRWLAPGLSGFNAGRLKEDLEHIVEKSRHEELSREDQERRAWIMQQIGWRLSKGEREELGWGKPEYGTPEGALSFVQPYTFITEWDMLPEKQRQGAWWQRENVFLRTQHQLVRHWLPKKYKLWWARKHKLGHLESYFEDVDEEIYNQKFFKELGVLQKHLEDMEEEIVGYDTLTVEEEQKIKKMFQDWVKEQEQWERLQEAY